MAKKPAALNTESPVKLDPKDCKAAAKAVDVLLAKNRKKVKKKSVSAAEKPKPRKEKIPREPHQTRPTPAEENAEIERRFAVWDYFKNGVSQRSISKHLEERGFKRHSLGTVHSDVQWCLDYQTNALGLSIEQWRANELAVLQDIRFTYMSLMKRTGFNVLQEDKTDAAKIVLATHDKLCKLLNLHKEPKVMLGMDDELAKLLGISPDQLPKPDGEQPES